VVGLAEMWQSYERLPQWQAILTASIVAWGRQPWRGLWIRRLIRNP
jgi:hypothetical protein